MVVQLTTEDIEGDWKAKLRYILKQLADDAPPAVSAKDGFPSAHGDATTSSEQNTQDVQAFPSGAAPEQAAAAEQAAPLEGSSQAAASTERVTDQLDADDTASTETATSAQPLPTADKADKAATAAQRPHVLWSAFFLSDGPGEQVPETTTNTGVFYCQ